MKERVCPYCHGILEEGNLHAPHADRLCFIPNGKNMKLAYMYSKHLLKRAGGVTLKADSLLLSLETFAVYCSTCKLIMFKTE